MEKDDKKPKLVARKMMKMMAAINQDNFDGKQQVTCYSCHRGTPHPVAIPVVAEAGSRPIPVVEHDEDNVATNLAAPDQIISKYVEAGWGASALAKVKSPGVKRDN